MRRFIQCDACGDMIEVRGQETVDALRFGRAYATGEIAFDGKIYCVCTRCRKKVTRLFEPPEPDEVPASALEVLDGPKPRFVPKEGR